MENIKKYNATLFTFIILNFFLLVGQDVLLYLNINSISIDSIMRLLTIPSLIMLLTTILNGVLSSNVKAMLVFMKKDNPLPASRLKTVLKNDYRFSISQVTEKHGPIPKEPKEQNIYWYQKMYKNNQNSAKIQDVHRKFLMTRDMTAMCFVIIFFSILNILFFYGTWDQVLIIIVEYLIVRLVAVNYGKRLVTTVVAESLE